MKKKVVKSKINKSAKTGKFVSNKYLKRNPATTVKQTVTKKV